MSELDVTDKTTAADTPPPSPLPDTAEPVGEPEGPQESEESGHGEAADDSVMADYAEPEEPEAPDDDTEPEAPDDAAEVELSTADAADGDAADGDGDVTDAEDAVEPEEPEAPDEDPEPEAPVDPAEVELSTADVADDDAADGDTTDAADTVDTVDARKQAAQADGLIDDAGRVPVEELDSGDRVRGRPCDDTGYEIRAEDLEYLGLDEEQVEAWQRFEAPLGMNPEQFTEFRESLNEALAADGIDPEQVDIRLQGSSAQFFSGSHKDFPTEQDLADQPEALSRLTEWMGDRTESERPARIPFDAKHLLGVEDADGTPEPPSDYDVQLSSDSMVAKAKETWEAADPEARRPDVIHPKYDFVDKETVQETFPALHAWKEHWEEETGREVAPALFTSEGPPDRTDVGKGISTHFRETDWIINRPGGDRDE
ncbi:hypothetical protein ABZX75_00630 [Streptomyces sp. NPDC003038]|uniref:hypothetical protein n=1 Tax=unclassified Streptomyces TaxID=2593676 RepID=UPI0033BAE472